MHDRAVIRAILELDVHLQSHEIDSSAFYAGGLLRSLLHLVRAVSTVDIDLI